MHITSILPAPTYITVQNNGENNAPAVLYSSVMMTRQMKGQNTEVDLL